MERSSVIEARRGEARGEERRGIIREERGFEFRTWIWLGILHILFYFVVFITQQWRHRGNTQILLGIIPHITMDLSPMEAVMGIYGLSRSKVQECTRGAVHVRTVRVF